MKKLIALCSLTLALTGAHLSAAPLGTAFTYQGRLTDGGNPANGRYDLECAIYDAASVGSQIGSVVTNLAVAVSNGLFTVSLDFGANVFTGGARWLAIGVRSNGVAGNYTPLNPRQPLTPTPYALYAPTAGTVTNGAIQSSQLGTAGPAPAEGQVLGYDGNSLFWRSPSVPGGLTLPYAGTASSLNPLFQVNNAGTGTSADGIVGTTASSASQISGVRGIATSSSGVVVGLYGTAVNSPDGTGVVGYGGATGGYFTSTQPGGRAGVFAGDVTVSGNISYGQLAKLDVADNFTATVRAADFKFGWSGRRGSPGLALTDGTDTLHLNFVSDWINTAIGGTTISARGYLSLEANRTFIRGFDGSGDHWFSYGTAANPDADLIMGLHRNGPNNYDLTLNGALSTTVLTIRGGADIAEPFKMSTADIPKGAVVVIDDENAGELKLSDRAYDHRVAGIVSGANGVNPGIALHQEGVIEGGQNVALSGRAYVQADASNSPIKPGDLLTTSNTLGHAMKVTDHAKAQGAIIGKAMSALKEGKGMVLVLVTLQ